MRRPVLALLAAGLPFLFTSSPAAADVDPAGDLESVATAAAAYESGQSLEPFRKLEDAVRQSVGNPEERREIETALLKLLTTSSSTLEAKKFACSQIGVIGSERAFPELEKLLTDAETTSLACLALSTYPPGRADALLRRALVWAQGEARVQILNTVGNRKDAKALPLLAGSAGEPDRATAEAAIAALGKLGTPAAWKAIAKLNASARPELSIVINEAQMRAAEGLAAAGNAKQAKALLENLLAEGEPPALRRRAFALLVTTDKDSGQERILEALSGPDPLLKTMAIALTAGVRTPGATEKFAAEIHHLKPEEQALMIESLSKRDDDAARVALAKALSSTEPLARRAAITALARMGDPYYASLLVRSASAVSEPAESEALEEALIGLKGGEATDKRLLAELKTAPPKARIILISTMVRRQGSAANPILLEETLNTDPAVAKAAFRALARSATAGDAPALLTKLAAVPEAGVRSEAESAVSQVLRRIEDPASRSRLVREALAKATTPESRISMLMLLPAAADPEALAALEKATGDAESRIREAAARALAEWPDASAREALFALYRQKDQTTLRGVALRGLVRILAEENAAAGPELADGYRQLIAGARGDGELKLILATLANYGQPEALTLALPMLSNPSVRPEAILAVRKIAEACKAQNPQLAEEAIKRLSNP